jgi:hypothetical protein
MVVSCKLHSVPNFNLRIETSSRQWMESSEHLPYVTFLRTCWYKVISVCNYKIIILQRVQPLLCNRRINNGVNVLGNGLVNTFLQQRIRTQQ